VLSHESYHNFQGIIRKDSPNGPTTDNVITFFFNNCIAYFLDRTRFVGITTTRKTTLEQNRSDQTFKLELTNITSKIPHVPPTDFAKIKMYDIIKRKI